MRLLTAPESPSQLDPGGDELVRSASPSPAGPIEPADLTQLPPPPAIGLPAPLQVLWFNLRQTDYVFHFRKKLGDVWSAHGYVRGTPALTSHPDHIRSLFTAPPELVPTLAAESPLRPVLGPNSVLIANGPRHLCQRKLLLPPFHGEAIARYEELIAAAAEREIAAWPSGRAFSLAPRMQAITLDVIMGGIFGIEGRPRREPSSTPCASQSADCCGHRLCPAARFAELMNLGRAEPVGLTETRSRRARSLPLRADRQAPPCR